MDGNEENDEIIIVNTSESDSPPAVETGDTLVIVDASGDSDSADTDSNATELDPLTERIVNLERDVDELREEVFKTSITADVALEMADTALEVTDDLAEQDAEILTAVDSADDAILDAVENADVEKDDSGDLQIEVPDIEPASAKVHPLFRPLSDWRS